MPECCTSTDNELMTQSGLRRSQGGVGLNEVDAPATSAIQRRLAQFGRF